MGAELTLNGTITELLIATIKHISEYCQSEIKTGNLSAKRRSTLGEAGIVIYEILTNLNIADVDRIILEKLLNKITQIVYDEEALFYFSSFYYSYRNVKKGLSEAQNHFIKANLDILAMRLKIRLVQMNMANFGNSTDNYFLSRLERLTWGIKYVFDKRCTDLYIPTLYVILNLHQTLLEMLESNIADRVTVNKNLLLVRSLLLPAINLPDIRTILAESVQLRFFLVDQQRRYQQLNDQTPSEFDEVDFDALDWVPQLRAIRSLGSHIPDRFMPVCLSKTEYWYQHLEETNPIARIILVSILVQYLRQIDHTALITLSLSYRSDSTINIEQFLPIYFSAYRAIPHCTIVQNEIDSLFMLNDEELRLRVCRSMINVDQVTVEREARKPHGVSEIADMEIPIEFEAGKTYYLCMPFISAREISQATVPIDYTHQVFRPFAFFDNCIVVFVTAKKCSQPLMNMVKQMREKFNWPIGIIEYTDLAALLKLNGQL